MAKQKALPNPISATEQQHKIETEFTKLMTDKKFQPQTQERYLTQLRCLFQNTPPNPTEQQIIDFLRNGRIDKELMDFIKEKKLSPTLIFVTAVKELIAKQKKN